MSSPAIGVWVDDAPSLILTPAYWDTVVQHGISTAALMLEGYQGGFDPRYTPEVLRVVRKLALDRDLEVVLTAWPEPTLKYLAQFEERIGTYLESAGACALEFDTEGNWHPSMEKGFPSLDKAGDALVDLFGRIQSKHDVRTELTTFPAHTENGRGADLAPHADRIFAQAYSVRTRKKGLVPWDSKFGPGKMQVYSLDRAKQVPGVGTTSGPLVCCGLAAYDQMFPGHTPEEAMRVAYDSACSYEPVEIRFWSSKWIFGARSNDYASRFLKSL